jgi:acetyl esterase/lipase
LILASRERDVTSLMAQASVQHETVMKSIASPGLACLFTLVAADLSVNHAAGQPAKKGEARKAAQARLHASAARVESDVTYGKAEGIDLKLDLYFPAKTNSGALPVAVYVHGGGWQHGDKEQGAGAVDIPEMVKRGYLVGSINYRLAPAHKFPAQIEDAKCAIRFLRAHAKEYNLDPNRIGVWGGSAGGHLVALLGTTDSSAGLEGNGGWEEQSSRVQAVVDMFGPADLTPGGSRGVSGVGENVFGAKSADDPVLKRASPITYVSKEDPPFLILHGDKDALVPLSQSRSLYDRLTEAGVSAKLVVVKNAGHGFTPTGGSPNPSRAELTQMIADFFDQHLRK